VTATFDPGFSGFGAGETARYCESLGVEHHIIPFDMPALLEEKGNPQSPCVLCSRMRRGCLYTLARKLGCNKLVLGQHMDDVVISFLISLSRGEGLTTMGPNVPSEDGSLRVIRPLIYARESLVAEAASGLEFPVFAGRKDNFLKNITLSNCTFEKLSDEDLPDYRHHGAAVWDRPVNNVIFSYAENVVVNNTSFTAK
jgi:tRNA(Ile)-lysidine synthase TilS/MesJ